MKRETLFFLEERQIITALKVQMECPIVLLVKLGSEECEEKCTVRLCNRGNELIIWVQFLILLKF